MMTCQGLEFSPRLAEVRLDDARRAFDESMLRRMVAFVLFTLGVNRSQIATCLEMPPGTLRSVIRRVLDNGVEGLLDHRRTDPLGREVGAPQQPAPQAICATLDADVLRINGSLPLPDSPIQRKVLLLSLIGKGMLSVEDVAQRLGLSVSHTRRLQRQLRDGDVEALIDQRRGQLVDYRVGPREKAEMLVEFVLELAESGSASGATVAQRLQQNCELAIPERTVRDHLSRLGLGTVKERLAHGLANFKKNCGA